MLWVMPKERRPPSPVTVTQLPVTRCGVCGRTIGHLPGKAAETLTRHYERTHPDMLERQGGPSPK